MLRPRWDETCLPLQNQPLAGLYTTFEMRWQVQHSNLGRHTPADSQSVHLDVCQQRHRWPSWNSAVTRLTVLGENGLRTTR